MSLARRSSAVKIVVSTSLMTGRCRLCAVSWSIESCLVAGLVLRHHVQREAFGDLFQHALRLLGLLEELGDLRQRGDLDQDASCSAAG